ncbi:MAG: GDP-mannose 6-dehydrogenase [Actinomycetota bacterium]|jgi:UDPglucose 6-dehydrogenase|nr:GDP-mannose 6-dehydrogenase [Actinomycetota bacterium]MEA2973380.1 GDP-mannose 6-dehydrogenase [Actinomycetota bacterium]
MPELLVVGAGTVGRATGLGLAARGHPVAFADVDDRPLGALRAAGHRATAPADVAWADVGVVFVCVSTRAADDGTSPFAGVLDAVDVVGAGLRGSSHRVTVAIRSTLTPGTTGELLGPCLERAASGELGVDFGLVVNPEFLRAATAAQDFERPWATVVGAADDQSGDAIAALYQPFGAPLVRCTPLEAELIKMGSNCFNALKISYFNELHALAQRLGADSTVVNQSIAVTAEGMWNPAYGTVGGTPFRGPCLPQDVESMARAGRDQGWEQRLIEATLAVNQAMGDGDDRPGRPA